MNFQKIFSACLPFFSLENNGSPGCSPSDDDLRKVEEIMAVLQRSEKAGREVQERVSCLVNTNSWTESLAKAMLNGVISAIEDGRIVAGALLDALRKSEDAAIEFARAHPVYTTLIALGIMVILLPWALEALGFGELGPVAGSFASWWQSLYRGYVSRRSLFAFLQRLGMVWRRTVRESMTYEPCKGRA